MESLKGKFIDGHSVTFDRSDINLCGMEFELVKPVRYEDKKVKNLEAFYRVKLHNFISELREDITNDYPSELGKDYVDIYMSEVYDAKGILDAPNGTDILEFYENKIAFSAL